MKNNIEVKIYVLYDPRECKVRYIGRTSKKNLLHRLIEHISKARYEHVYYPGKKSSYKNNWIKSLLTDGVEPCIKLFTTVTGWKESHDVESCLINKYRESRSLTNYTDKGQGVINNYVEFETRTKISTTLKSFYTTNLNPRAKAVDVYDLEGNYIKTCASATTFAKELNVPTRHVTRVASGTYGRRQVKGFQVVYSGSEPPCQMVYKERSSYIIEKKRKFVILENIETGEKTEHKGVELLLQELGIPRHLYHNRRKKTSIVEIGHYRFIPGPV